MYDVEYDDGLHKDVKRLDIGLVHKIFNKIESYLAQDPLNLGEPLLGGFHGLHRYRYGDYRIIYQVIEERNTIYITNIKHRRESYK